MFKKWFRLFFEKSMTSGEIDKKIADKISEDNLKIDWLQSMQKLDVKDGDIVVLRCNKKLSREAYLNIRDAVKEAIQEFGFGVHVMIFEDGMDIGVLRKETP